MHLKENEPITDDPVREAIERAAASLVDSQYGCGDPVLRARKLRQVELAITAELLPAIAALDEAKDQRIAELEGLLQDAFNMLADNAAALPGNWLPLTLRISAALSPANPNQGASDGDAPLANP